MAACLLVSTARLGAISATSLSFFASTAWLGAAIFACSLLAVWAVLGFAVGTSFGTVFTSGGLLWAARLVALAWIAVCFAIALCCVADLAVWAVVGSSTLSHSLAAGHDNSKKCGTEQGFDSVIHWGTSPD